MSDQRPVFNATLLDAVHDADAAGVLGPGFLSRVRELSIYIVYGPGTTAGSIVIEAAPRPDFTGTWAVLKTVSWVAANRVHHVAVTGVHSALRARVKNAILGGTASVTAVGN